MILEELFSGPKDVLRASSALILEAIRAISSFLVVCF